MGAAKTPNYNRLLEKAGDKVLDFAMKNRVVEIDRDADRRYTFATRKARQLAEKGEKFPQSSPMMEKFAFTDKDGKTQEFAIPDVLVNQLHYAKNYLMESVETF